MLYDFAIRVMAGFLTMISISLPSTLYNNIDIRDVNRGLLEYRGNFPNLLKQISLQSRCLSLARQIN